MGIRRTTGHTGIGRRGTNVVGGYSVTDRGRIKRLEQTAAREGHGREEKRSQLLPGYNEAIYIDRNFMEPVPPNGGAHCARSYVVGTPERGAFTQASRQISSSRAERVRGTDGTAPPIYRTVTLQEVCAALERHANGMGASDHFETPVDGFSIVRSEYSVPLVRRASRPAVCITIQGAVWSIEGENRHECRAGQAFMLSVENPGHCAVPVASRTNPYMGLVIELDRAYMHQIVEELGIPRKRAHKDGKRGGLPIDLSPQFLNCIVRAVGLLDTPEAVPMLYPGVMREICYWLLTGPACDEIVDLAMESFQDGRILQAIQLLRGKFSRPIKVEQLATAAGMSPATFHRQFKSVTSMSPMQYLKQLRLVAARRLMITSNSNVESVANEVGYLSASQFSREYTRMFGKPPRRDVSNCESSQSASSRFA